MKTLCVTLTMWWMPALFPRANHFLGGCEIATGRRLNGGCLLILEYVGLRDHLGHHVNCGLQRGAAFEIEIRPIQSLACKI
jgi:hypothetical protein